MTNIGDIPVGELRERFRREILENVDPRRKEANEAFSELCKISSVIYSGGTIAVLSFIASRKEGAVPSYAIISFTFFILSLLSFALFLYLHYQLHAARAAHYANSAHRFFFSEITLEELIDVQSQLQSKRLYRLAFWVPFSFATFGFCFGTRAMFLAANAFKLAGHCRRQRDRECGRGATHACRSMVATIPYTVTACYDVSKGWPGKARRIAMTTLKVGIAAYKQFKAYKKAIGRGKHKRKPNEPKVWFSSIESFAQVLSERNRELLRVIAETKPQSLNELAKMTGRDKSNLARTLKTMERYGLVRLENGKGRTRVPRTPYTDVVLDLSLRAKRGARRTLVPV